MFHPKLISLLIALRPRRLDSRTFRFVEEAKLDSRDIGVDRHLTAERIDFTNDLTFGLAANGWVATHLGHRIQISCQE